MLSIFTKKRFISLPSLRVILIALAFIVCCAAAQNTFAATFTVTRNDDRNAACVSGTDCSLREAVGAANAAATDDTINFAAGLTLITLASGDTGDILISNNGSLAITGPGANVLTIDGGAGINRIFYTNEADVNISGLTMQGGNGGGALKTGSGGAIYAGKGTLIFDSVVVRNNGGDSVFGGGIYFDLNVDSTVINSTFSGNDSVQCGGFANVSGTLIVVNTTVSGNSASFGGNAGGGFCNTGGMPVRNSTITNNSATAATGSGGGFFNTGTLRIGNTIIAGNTAAAQPEIRNESLVESAGNNLIGDSAGDSTDTFNSITYKTAAGMEDILDTPPLLGALQNNGGTTPTRALLTGSPAIDKGGNALAFNVYNNIALAADQRGFARIVDGDGNGTAIVDIGAFEFVPTGTTAASVTIGGRVRSAKGIGIANARVTMTGADGKTLTAISNETGYFRFADVPAGETYIFSAAAKRYQFSQPTQVHTINEDTDNINFVAAGNLSRNL
jgi:hypothetical protein